MNLAAFLPWQTKSILCIGDVPFIRLYYAVFCHDLPTGIFYIFAVDFTQTAQIGANRDACSSQMVVYSGKYYYQYYLDNSLSISLRKYFTLNQLEVYRIIRLYILLPPQRKHMKG